MRWLALLFLAGPAFAQTPYDGVYRPAEPWADGWDCTTIGSDGGALAIQGNRLLGVENACELQNPIAVRDMNATLYDATCSGEGETSVSRVMLMLGERGVFVIRDAFVSEWERCPG